MRHQPSPPPTPPQGPPPPGSKYSASSTHWAGTPPPPGDPRESHQGDGPSSQQRLWAAAATETGARPGDGSLTTYQEKFSLEQPSTETKTQLSHKLCTKSTDTSPDKYPVTKGLCKRKGINESEENWESTLVRELDTRTKK